MNTSGTSSNYAGLMTDGSHNAHSRRCTHPNIAFCAPCNATYCRDCSQEWTAATVSWYYAAPRHFYPSQRGVTTTITGGVANCLTNAPTVVANSRAGHG